MPSSPRPLRRFRRLWPLPLGGLAGPGSLADLRQLATGDWRLATGDWRLAAGDWRLATGCGDWLWLWRLATGNWRLATGDWQLVLGPGDWRLPTGNWRLALGPGDWRLPTGDWRLATGDWLWQLATPGFSARTVMHDGRRITPSGAPAAAHSLNIRCMKKYLICVAIDTFFARLICC